MQLSETLRSELDRLTHNGLIGVLPSKGTLGKNGMGGFRVAGHVMQRAGYCGAVFRF